MTRPYTLFEISWEVCNKIGGIHTVLSSKAATAVAQIGDDYWTVGPWLLSDTDRSRPFEDDPEHAEFADACRQLGLPVRVGRWLVGGRPRCILIEFSSLYDRKNDVLTSLWDEHGVDSISGAWDYVEPVLFGWAAARVIEEFVDRFQVAEHRRAIVHAHQWHSAAAVLELSTRCPGIATIFTTHATVLGRAMSAAGWRPEDGLGGRSPAELAAEHHVTAQHSLEGVAVRLADVFTTVSPVSAKEAETFHQRVASPVLPNGFDPALCTTLAGPDEDVPASRALLERVASRFLGVPDLADAAFVVLAGAYEFHNKGIDLLLDAAARLDEDEGRAIVVWLLVPAGNSGLRSEVRERLAMPAREQDPIGISTHHLFDEERDPIRARCIELGLTNQSGARVKIIHVPMMLQRGDTLLDRSYEAVLAAMDVGVFPSVYEPWGYTPQEALALGVPAITTDAAGFGRWARSAGLTADDGVIVLDRVGVEHRAAAEALAQFVGGLVAEPPKRRSELRTRSRATASRTSWSDLWQHYEEAYRRAAERLAQRAPAAPAALREPRPAIVVTPASAAAPRLQFFEVSATLPQELRALERIARNLWWCWDHEATALFREISPERFHASGHNPLRSLRQASPEDLAARAAEPDFVARVDATERRLDAYLAARSERYPVGDGAALTPRQPIAYFCAEFALHESIPIYSGGLGVLAGDHLKSASDLNLPFIGVGLFYSFGYMVQQLTADGQQLAVDRQNDPTQLPIEALRREDGSPIEIHVPMPGRDMALRAWLVRVGRVDLYLLDADLPQNREEDRAVTRNLYGGDHEMRIRQLIALGRGGVRLLGELGIEPAVWHMNEGHAAFLTLERLGRLVRGEGLTFETAREAVRQNTAFTTHTPVPAGHDRFSEDLMRRYFSDVPDWVGVPWERFMAFGRAQPTATDFNMTYLALTFSAYCNGVSELHGTASRELLHAYWPQLLREEVPVDAITNGVHLPTWTSPQIAELLGVDATSITGSDFRDRARGIDRAALWHVRQASKRALSSVIRERLQCSFVSRNDSPVVLTRILDGLDEDALWIGFARRFAPYKRAGLLYSDLPRLRAILDDTDRPVRILVAGKAHPRDNLGQDLLRGIVSLARHELAGRVIFVEDYDMALGRALVRGVDIWLNTPTRMLEASGTSGMKAAANGGLNLSIADGWWPEGADGRNGWTIGKLERSYQQQELQNQLDAESLYRLLEEEIVPLFYERGADGIPERWLDRVVHALETLPPIFDTDRMVGEYYDRAYRDLARAHFAMAAEPDRLRESVANAQRLRRGFGSIKILELRHSDVSDVRVGDQLEAFVRIDLGELAPEDVVVELVIGDARPEGGVTNPRVVMLNAVRRSDGTAFDFEGRHPVTRSGRYGAGLRVRPRRPSASPASLRDLVLWA